MSLGGRVAVVTGGRGPLGSAACDALEAAGARVVATTRGDGPGRDEGPRRIEPVDLTDEAAVLGLADRVRERYGACHALVATAGGYFAGPPVVEQTAAQWRAQLELNATTAFLACRALVPLIAESGGGSVVLVGSRAAVRPFAGASAYAASKAAVVALGQTLAAEGRELGVRANVVLPSVLDTPANRAAMPDADPARWVPTERFAGVIAWLCSDAAQDVSGAVIPVYGNA